MQLTAFVVVLGTLVLQGLTVRPLLKALKLPADRTIETEIEMGRSAALQGALSSLQAVDTPAGQQLKTEYSEAINRAHMGAPRSKEDAELRLQSLSAARLALDDLRITGTIGDDAFRSVEQELDLLELSMGLPRKPVV